MNMYDRIKQKLQESTERKNWTSFRWLGDKETVRIMPKPKGQRDIFLEGGRHFSIGDSKQNRLCPAAVYASLDEEQACPVCEAANELLNSSSSDDKAMGKELKPARRFFFNAVVRTEEEKGVQILEVPETVWNQIVSCYFISEGDEADIDIESGPYLKLEDGTIIFNFTDLNKGRDFLITREKTGKRTTYTTQMKPTGRKLGTPAQAKEWISSMGNLDEVIPNACPSYSELETLLFGGSKEKEEDEPEEELELEEEELGLEEENEPEEENESEEELELEEGDLELDENGEIVVKPKKVAKKTTKPSSVSNLDQKMRERLRGKKK